MCLTCALSKVGVVMKICGINGFSVNVEVNFTLKHAMKA